jgi:hypothetical protein
VSHREKIVVLLFMYLRKLKEVSQKITSWMT